MSLESLGSLAHTFTDQYLRENFRRIVTGRKDVMSVIEGFRGADVCMPLQSSLDAPPSASADIVRGSSYARAGSEHLKRRNSSVQRPRQDMQQQASSSLHTVYASTSLGYPVSPRIPRALQAREIKARSSRRTRLILGLCIAAGLLALCIISVCFAPLLHSLAPHISISNVAAPWAMGTPRRLLDFEEETLVANPNASGRLLHDAYVAHHRQHTHNFHASRWDTHMSVRMARQLAEEISGRTSFVGGEATTLAEAPSADITSGLGSPRSPSSSTSSTYKSSPSSMSDSSWRHETTRTAGSNTPSSPSVLDGSWNQESTRASKSGSSSSNALGGMVTQSGQPRQQQAGSADSTASSALTGQYDIYRSVPGVSTSTGGAVGSVPGISGGSSAGVSSLQQAGTDSSRTALAAGSGTNTLQYSNGYAEIGGDVYKVAQHTQSAGQCAALCASDASCVAWTRVAGGRSDVRSCHLKRSLSGLAGSPEASMSVQQRAQAINYVESSKVILESGTRNPNALPSALYGCPYPSTANGDCKPPASCNCYQGACYGSC